LKFEAILLIMLVVLSLTGGFLNSPLSAQSVNYPLVIKSNPTGASVELIGDYTIIGQTPCHIRQELAGRFQLRVLKTGYETRKQVVALAFDAPRVFEIQLNPKTRWKASLRSCLVPGWGQYYAEKPLKGLMLGSTFFTSLVIYSYAAHRYTTQVEAYAVARAALRQPLGNAEYEHLLQETLKKGQTADRAYELRRKWTWITSSIFIYNLLDALIFFPKFELGGIRQTNLHFSVNAGSNATGCSLSLQF
jgi:hypothetical protein